MKIAVIGKGYVGAALGGRWAAAGHEVVYGVGDPAKGGGPGGTAAAVADAPRAAEVVLLAVPWGAARAALASAGALTGEVLLARTNPLTPDLAGRPAGPTA